MISRALTQLSTEAPESISSGKLSRSSRWCAGCIWPERRLAESTLRPDAKGPSLVGRLEALAQLGKEGHNGTNIRIFMPLNTMRVLFPLKEQNSEDGISFLNYQPRTREEHVAAKQEVHQVIARRHNFSAKSEDAFEDWDTIEGSRRVGLIFDAMDSFLGAVGLVTLALGAIGIINIMLVSVSERTREIGLLKALGATHRSVLTQFFMEGMFLTLLSGGLGMAVAAGFMSWMHTLPSPPGFDPPTLVPTSAALAIGTLTLAGVVAGLYPARRAALLAPVEALRKD